MSITHVSKQLGCEKLSAQSDSGLSGLGVSEANQEVYGFTADEATLEHSEEVFAVADGDGITQTS